MFYYTTHMNRQKVKEKKMKKEDELSLNENICNTTQKIVVGKLCNNIC